MRKCYSDEHLDEALCFAIQNKPCIIACHTVKGLDQARLFLSTAGHTVSYIRVSTRRQCYTEQLNAFEDGVADFLVISDHMLHLTHSRRVGASLAIASSTVGGREHIYARSIREGRNPERLFYRVRQRKEPT